MSLRDLGKMFFWGGLLSLILWYLIFKAWGARYLFVEFVSEMTYFVKSLLVGLGG